MNRETRTVCYDEDLNMEAYHLEGLVRPFPSHFHEHYVIGYVEEGRRHLKCGTREFLVRPGDVILFNPGDSHCCEQLEGGRFSYRAVNIPAEVMARFVREITGDGEPPVFCGPVIENEEAAYHLQKLHRMMMEGSGEFEKEEHLLLLLGTLLGLGGRPSADLPAVLRHLLCHLEFCGAGAGGREDQRLHLSGAGYHGGDLGAGAGGGNHGHVRPGHGAHAGGSGALGASDREAGKEIIEIVSCFSLAVCLEMWYKRDTRRTFVLIGDLRNVRGGRR